MSSSATSTPSKGGRSKYANDEERKAAARERQRIYAAKKRAEAKEAKLRAALDTSISLDTSFNDGSSTVTLESSQSSPKAKRTPKKSIPTTIVDTADNITTTTTTHRKRVAKKKEEQQQPVAVNGDNTFHESLKTEDKDDTVIISHTPLFSSFSEDLTVTDFLPPPHLYSDYILVHPQPSPTSQLQSFLGTPLPPQDYAIVHIPGNPGLISYYSTFLSALSGYLSDTEIPSCLFTVFGASLGGFDVSKKPKDSGVNTYKFYSLQDQITRQVEILEHLISHRPQTKIILMGHSVGSYILLETLRNLKEKGLGGNIIGGIGLFPTLTHIGKSRSGRKASFLLKIPGLIPFLNFLANLLVVIIPTIVWGWLIALFMRRFDQEARATTISFLKSPNGIRQGIYMGRDEIRGIKDDMWDEGIWGSEAVPASTELVFYYGKKDHWVFDEERERLIQERGRGGVAWTADGEVVRDLWKPKMMVCEDGVPHSFCIGEPSPTNIS
ncbi:hypothetical protein ABW19_dt0207846 [Dactylella cylindrospora]|nr:hypothetical protein ABW19_dt0207846 [Dactylella cylindrospora]